MINLVFTMRRRDGLMREEFQRYWHDNHGALMKRHAPALHIRRYVQFHSRDTDLDEAIAAPRDSKGRYYDGIARSGGIALMTS